MHEVLLEAMYDVHSVAMYDVSRLSPQQVVPAHAPPLGQPMPSSKRRRAKRMKARRRPAAGGGAMAVRAAR